jgi:hypothetical protein
LFKGYLKLDGKTGTEYEWHSKSVIEYDTKHEWKRYDSKLGWKEYDTINWVDKNVTQYCDKNDKPRIVEA